MRTVDYQHRWSVNVWAEIVSVRLIGLFFSEEFLTTEMFVRFLTEDFPNLVKDIPLRDRIRMWLQLDGVPPHFGINMRQELNRMFPNKWIGRGDTISCEITRLNMFGLLLLRKSEGVSLFSTSYHSRKYDRKN